MAKERGFDALCASLYASVLDPGRLQEVCAGLSDATGSHVGAIMVHDAAVDGGRLEVLTGADPAEMARYEREFAADNPWMRHGASRLHTGAVVDSDSVLSRSELRRTRYYNEYLRLGDIEQSVALCAYRDADSIVTATVSRSGRLRPYGEAELETMRRIVPHWVNAHAIRRELGRLQRQVATLEAALAALPTAVLLLDAQRRPARRNAAADALCSAGWLRVDGTGLAARGCHARDWQRMLQAACTGLPSSGAPLRCPGRLLLRDEAGAPALVAAVHPLPARSPPAEPGREAAILFLHPASAPPRPALHAVLRELFGLTDAEAALALAFLRHAELAGAAQACRISAASARTRLKVVYGKTGAHGQAELMRLLAALAAATAH
ncbi:hypothetical protein LDO32_11560 [Luteimonas sp. Y-2-2-4F]|nr:hypothetical protein [Luteimonas sp. Y-2-2-4F]MCD9032363.1 hypothetical protein [Luteimonas sp. Y-2-2-4F]